MNQITQRWVPTETKEERDRQRAKKTVVPTMQEDNVVIFMAREVAVCTCKYSKRKLSGHRRHHAICLWNECTTNADESKPEKTYEKSWNREKNWRTLFFCSTFTPFRLDIFCLLILLYSTWNIPLFFFLFFLSTFFSRSMVSLHAFCLKNYLAFIYFL